MKFNKNLLVLGLTLFTVTVCGVGVLSVLRTSSPSTPKWCDAAHAVPYIPADQCGGGSSCDRAQFIFNNPPQNWRAFCDKINRSLQ